MVEFQSLVRGDRNMELALNKENNTSDDAAVRL